MKLTKNQLRKWLLRVDNVLQFSLAHDISRRTLMRLRTKTCAEPTERTKRRILDALLQDGVITNEEAGATIGEQPVPGRKPATLAGRHEA